MLDTLRAHESELHRRGIDHASIVGSVARRQEGAESDVDVLVDLNPAHPMGIFEYARLELDLGELLGGACDLVNRAALDPRLRDHLLRDAVHAF